MKIVVNGTSQSVPEGSTLTDLLEILGLDAARVAVELDREIVKAPLWPQTILQPDAKVEIVMFVGGG